MVSLQTNSVRFNWTSEHFPVNKIDATGPTTINDYSESLTDFQTGSTPYQKPSPSRSAGIAGHLSPGRITLRRTGTKRPPAWRNLRTGATHLPQTNAYCAPSTPITTNSSAKCVLKNDFSSSRPVLRDGRSCVSSWARRNQLGSHIRA